MFRSQYSILLLPFFLSSFLLKARAQQPDSLPDDLAFRMTATTDRWQPERLERFYVVADALTFFKDNENEGRQAYGYTLPGLWLQPRIAYRPLANIKFEAGFHALIYEGANKYPCYAYHDIGMWKGNQYQSGAHLLPFFRAQARLGNVTFVLGDIYGGANHRLMEPLMNPEINLTQDPEMGFQLLVETPRYRLDAWVNWQSYIFEADTHQEAFTVGIGQRLLLNDAASPFHWYIPLDILAQHRGGEQDITSMGTQTLWNFGAGVGLQWNAHGSVLRRLTAEAALLGAWQQVGHLWPFKSGFAGSLQLAASLWQDWRVELGVVGARKFATLYGAPFYNTFSLQRDGGIFASVLTPHAALEWSHIFAPGYMLGAKASFHPSRVGERTFDDGTREASAMTNNFAFGIYLRLSPSWLLGK